MKSISISLLCMLQLLSVEAFAPTNFCRTAESSPITLLAKKTDREVEISRRDALTITSLASFGILTGLSEAANASGGATAGGAYLLSAKQRYNARVTEAVRAYLALSTSLEAGSLDATKAFFTTEEVGGWKDITAAGYLLANAFRRSSTTPPDKLPAVKGWKAFAAEQENLQKALKKKDIKKVKESYTNSQPLLEAYLELVELPPIIEIGQ